MLQDPLAVQGQWFAGGGIGAPSARPLEFHDNAIGSGGGFAGTTAINGYVSALNQNAGGITSFVVRATITNDTVFNLSWQPGANSHGESQTLQPPYVGDMYETMLVAEFALTDLGNQPAPWGAPYTQITPEILAMNENDSAWYCYSMGSPQGNPGNYYVPAWDFGTILLGQSVTRDLLFNVNGAISPLDSRFLPLMTSFTNQVDILSNRTTSLKISNWVEGIAIDNGAPYLSDPLEGSNASVFFVPEASTTSLLALLGLVALRRRR